MLVQNPTETEVNRLRTIADDFSEAVAVIEKKLEGEKQKQKQTKPSSELRKKVETAINEEKPPSPPLPVLVSTKAVEDRGAGDGKAYMDQVNSNLRKAAGGFQSDAEARATVHKAHMFIKFFQQAKNQVARSSRTVMDSMPSPTLMMR